MLQAVLARPVARAEGLRGPAPSALMDSRSWLQRGEPLVVPLASETAQPQSPAKDDTKPALNGRTRDTQTQTA